MFRKMMKYSIILIITFCYSTLNASTIYVDQTLSSSITNGTYNKVTRTSGGTDGNAYRTLREVIWGTNGTNGAASAGDTILLRGGTYREAWGNAGSYGAAMQIPQRLNGTSWTAGSYTIISSYPGEWAILDGSTDGYYFGVGYGNLSWDNGAGALRYIKFERLGITGGSSAGLGIVLGPVWVTYCYIYENGKGAYGDGNRGGISGRRLMNSIIEYNYFYNNSGTSDHNKAHIVIYSDYLYQSYTYDFNNCNRDNEIRYNLFEGSTNTAFKDKAAQFLGAHPSPYGFMTDMTNRAHGNKIHHNIGSGCQTLIYSKQDYAQIHNNISLGGSITSVDGSAEYPVFHRSVYNNTVIGSYISETIGYTRTESELDLAWFCTNNIISNFSYSDYSPSIGIAVMWRRDSPCTYDYTWNDTYIDRNLIYRPGSTSYHFGLPNSYACKSSRWVTTSAFNTATGTTNYTTSTDGLFLGSSGANRYKINSSFSLGSGRTAGAGGVGANHPYLSGVTIPTYLGAVDPNNSSWVDTVLGLANLQNLIAGGGSNPPVQQDTTPPASPGGVNVNIIQ